MRGLLKLAQIIQSIPGRVLIATIAFGDALSAKASQALTHVPHYMWACGMLTCDRCEALEAIASDPFLQQSPPRVESFPTPAEVDASFDAAIADGIAKPNAQEDLLRALPGIHITRPAVLHTDGDYIITYYTAEQKRELERECAALEEAREQAEAERLHEIEVSKYEAREAGEDVEAFDMSEIPF